MATYLKTPKSFKNPIRIARTDGHTKIIGYEYEPVEQMFLRDAIGLGAQIKGVEDDEAVSDAVDDSRSARIRSVLIEMIDARDNKEGADEFTAEGLPHLKAVTKRFGSKVTREEVYPIWEELKAEADEEKGDDE